MHAQLDWGQVIDLAIQEHSTFWPEKNLVALAVCFGSLSCSTMKRRSIRFDAFARIWAGMFQYTLAFILLLLSALTWMNTSEPAPVPVISSQPRTIPPPCFTDEVVYIGSWAVLFSSTLSSFHHSGTGWSWSHLSITLIRTGYLMYVFANGDQAILLLRLARDLQRVVMRLCCRRLDDRLCHIYA